MHAAVVIGVGNAYRCDDGVGPAVTALLRARSLPGVRIVDSLGEASDLIELWRGAPLAVVVDAVVARPSHPGQVHRLTVPALDAPDVRPASSHGMHLGEVVGLARALDRLPGRLLVYAIEAARVEYGTELSAEVAEAAARVADEVAAQVAAATGPPTRAHP